MLFCPFPAGVAGVCRPRQHPEDLSPQVIAKTPGLKLDLVHLGGWGGFDQATEEVISTFIEELEKNKDLDKSNIVVRRDGERGRRPGC